jgi:hypothetical protein
MNQVNMNNEEDKVLFTDYFNGKDIFKTNVLSDSEKNIDIFYFLHGDSKDNFEKNLLIQPKDWHYRTKEITYRINSYGYRAKEFNEINWSESIVIFGCSMVFGTGVAEDETISYYISQITGRDVINLGIPASSNYLMYYNSLMMRKKYGVPYAVFFLWTCLDRFTYFSHDTIKNIGSWNTINTDDKLKIDINIFNCLTSDPSHNAISTYCLINSARDFWKDKTIYHDSTFFRSTKIYGDIMDFIFNDYDARDLLHPGRKTNEYVANMFSKQII